MTEPSTSHVEAQITARIQAAKVRVAAAKERRDDLAQARRRGLAHRHARKLRNLAEAEQRAQQQRLDEDDGGQDDEDDQERDDKRYGYA